MKGTQCCWPFRRSGAHQKCKFVRITYCMSRTTDLTLLMNGGGGECFLLHHPRKCTSGLERINSLLSKAREAVLTASFNLACEPSGPALPGPALCFAPVQMLVLTQASLRRDVRRQQRRGRVKIVQPLPQTDP